MKGEILENYYSGVTEEISQESQTNLSNWSTDNAKTKTRVAVVSDPIGGITEVCDEHIPELGMPISELNDFRQRREELEKSYPETKAHNKAIRETDLEEKYIKHLQKQNIQSILDNLADRVKNGENIELVCFEKHPKWCHRHILKETLKEKL